MPVNPNVERYCAGVEVGATLVAGGEGHPDGLGDISSGPHCSPMSPMR
jgi:hypothetical protein